jgi:hypothetical protein
MIASSLNVLRRFIISDSSVQTTEQTPQIRMGDTLAPAGYLPFCVAPANFNVAAVTDRRNSSGDWRCGPLPGSRYAGFAEFSNAP